MNKVFILTLIFLVSCQFNEAKHATAKRQLFKTENKNATLMAAENPHETMSAHFVFFWWPETGLSEEEKVEVRRKIVFNSKRVNKLEETVFALLKKEGPMVHKWQQLNCQETLKSGAIIQKCPSFDDAQTNFEALDCSNMNDEGFNEQAKRDCEKLTLCLGAYKVMAKEKANVPFCQKGYPVMAKLGKFKATSQEYSKFYVDTIWKSNDMETEKEESSFTYTDEGINIILTFGNPKNTYTQESGDIFDVEIFNMGHYEKLLFSVKVKFNGTYTGNILKFTLEKSLYKAIGKYRYNGGVKLFNAKGEKLKVGGIQIDFKLK